jgi:DNA-binding transcriptional LysR family regulator
MNYTLHQLQVFLKITQTKSITKAAQELHLTQPAVSIQLKNLQDQFAIPLTEIVGRQLYVTDFGKEIAKAAENILNEVYAINYKTLAFKNQLAGRLKLSVVSTAKYVMPFFLTDFLKQNDGIELVMDVTNKAKVIESMAHNEVDFSLVSILPEQFKIQSVTLMKNQLYLVGNTDRVFNKEKYDINLLEKLPLIYREAGSGTRFTMEQFIKNNDLHVIKKMELTSNEAVKQAVIAGLGYSIMPIIGIKNELKNNVLQIIPIKKLPILSEWNMIWLMNKNLSPVAAAFLEFVKTTKEKIIKEKFDWVNDYQA